MNLGESGVNQALFQLGLRGLFAPAVHAPLAHNLDHHAAVGLVAGNDSGALHAAARALDQLARAPAFGSDARRRAVIDKMMFVSYVSFC